MTDTIAYLEDYVFPEFKKGFFTEKRYEEALPLMRLNRRWGLVVWLPRKFRMWSMMRYIHKNGARNLFWRGVLLGEDGSYKLDPAVYDVMYGS